MRSARVALVGLSIALAAAAASAENKILVGVDSIRFAWAPAAGTPLGYMVSVSNRGGALTPYLFVGGTSIDIPVVPGDQIRIAVAAGARDSTGAFRLGPLSSLSDRAWILSSPALDASGTWLIQCAACPSLALRSLADASVVEAEGPGLPAPWLAIGRATLESGSELVVWFNPTTGEMELWDAHDYSPIPGGTAVAAVTARPVGGADFDGDGVEEFVIQNAATNAVSLWALTPGGFERVAALPGPNAFLAVAEDLTGDGKVDLLWHDLAAGTLDMWSVIGDPLLGGSLTSLYQLPAPRVISGFPTDARVVDTGDYDADGHTDLLWRFSDGRLSILYLSAGRYRRYGHLPAAAGDVDRIVVGSFDADGTPGAEIALQDRITKAISILFPAYTDAAARITVLTPGSQWRVVDIAE